jgi:RNA polymerase sigma factor (sigma-70 family)
MLPEGGRHAGRRFPATRRSVVAAAGDPDPEARRRAWDELVESYWLPVHSYLRWHWREGAEEARDLTQEFFAAAFDRGTFDRYDPERSRFRTWLRLCLDGFMANHRKAAGRLKRGGAHGANAALSLDAPGAEAVLAASGAALAAGGHGAADPEAVFQREWVRSLFGLAVADLRRHCEATGRALQFQLFARHDLDGVPGFDAAGAAGPVSGGRPTYGALAAAFGLTPIQVTNHLAAARRSLRRLALRRLRRLTASDAEFRAEARALFGIEVPAAERPGAAGPAEAR